MFRGFDPERDRLVAIKLFRLDLPPDRVHRLVAALQRLTSGALKHPAIAAPIAAGMQENAAYLVEEYVAADSLDVVLRDQGPAPLADALRVARQLADAVDAGVAHGAIHPRDVLLSAHDVRVTGFGIGPALEQVGIAAPLRRPYTAPERLAGAAWDRRADIFSIAAVMYDVLTGKRITGTGETGVPALADVAGADAGALAAVFGRALAENPADRHDTASAFAEELAQSQSQAKAHGARRRPQVARQPPAGARETAEPPLPLDEPDLPLQPEAAAAASLRPRSRMADRPPEAPAHARPAPTPAVTSVPSVDAAAPTAETEPSPASAPRPKPAPERGPSPPVVPPPPTAAPQPSGRPAAPPPVAERGAAPPPPMLLSALDRSRSAMWPLALAFVVGLGLGIPFGFGLYPVMSQTQPDGAASGPATAPVAAPAAPAGPQVVERPPVVPSAVTPEPQRAPTASPAALSQPSSQPAAPQRQAAPAAAAAARPAPSPASPPANPGRLLVRTTPAGARVYVDGRDHGASPAEVRGLPFGVHTVRVARAGYADEERSVAVTAERPAQNLTIALTRAAAAVPARAAAPPAAAAPAERTASVRIESRPAGASVFLDERLIGTTPLVISEVPLGAHQVRLELEGYRPWAVSTDVTAGGDNHITGSLER